DCPEEPCNLGDSITVVITLKNTGPIPIPWVLVEDALSAEALLQRPPRLEVDGPRLLVTQMGPRHEKELRYEITFRQRGYYQIGPLLVESGDLFGLQRRFRVLTTPRFVMVYPKTVPLDGYDIVSKRPVGEVKISHRLFEDPTRIAGIREYQRGDSMTRIHWRATARTGQLQSKTYEPSCVAGATLVLDFHKNSFQRSGSEYQAELAVTVAASVAHALFELGQQTGLVTNGRDAADRIREEGWGAEFVTRGDAQGRVGMAGKSDRLRPLVVDTGRGADQFQRILEALARVEQTDGLTFQELVSETASRLPRDASVIAVLADVPEETAVALGSLKRRGFAVTALLILRGEAEYHDWAVPPEWAGRLLAEGVEFRRINDENELATLGRDLGMFV
ncbi:MAG TPA: DUF58 domain-containing protein, partial [Roseimicrobium sp.]|nr:DUF58 domain-containing protein [Roseimicrobium sp.]